MENPELQIIEDNLNRLQSEFAKYNPFRGVMGLLPDEIHFSEAYQKIKKEHAIWFKKLQAYNKAEMKRRKANGTKHYTEIYGVRVNRMQELFFSKWIVNNNIAMNTLTPEQRTAKVNQFLTEKFPSK